MTQPLKCIDNFAHRFVPRYTTREHARPVNAEGSNFTPDELHKLATLTDRIYCGDVCERCGAVVNAPKPA